MSIIKIAHLADIHVRKTPTRNEEYTKVLKKLITSLKQKKPDRIVIVGDLVNDYLDLQPEQIELISMLLNELADIAPVRITRGNHDMRKKNIKRTDSIKAMVNTIKNSNIVYYDKTGFYTDDNIIWVVWHHGDTKNNPWKTKEGKKINAYRNENDCTLIDLFHDPINGCKSVTGFDMKSKSYYKISDYIGDFSFLGDIHKKQYFADKTKAYCGSLIAQDFAEGDDNFHGYLLWNIKTKAVEEVSIKNDWSFKNVNITPFIDFDDLDFEIDNPSKHMKVRFVWNTLPQSRNKDSERSLSTYIKKLYPNCVISHKNQFLATEDVDINESVTLENITEKTVQHEIFNEYLSKIGTDEEVIKDVIALDEEIFNEIELDESSNIEWNIVKFGGKNFMSYGDVDINWIDMDGLFQITGINTAGKTTIIKLISYLLFGKTIETESRTKFGDKRFVNNRNGAKSCEGYLVIEANGEYYGIKKKTIIKYSKDGEINGAPTTLSYYLLSSPDEVMDDTTSFETLDGDKRAKTQEKLNRIIGTYNNFMRIVMTTSDTLNKILSNDMAEFIDSLLFDSGLDIFDVKLDVFKKYQKRISEKTRVTCNVELVTEQNKTLKEEIGITKTEMDEIETVTLVGVQKKITIGRKYVEDLTKKLYTIDPEIYNLDIKETKETIKSHNDEILKLEARRGVLTVSIENLKETYDEQRLIDLTKKKDTHKTNEHELKLKIKSIEQEIRDIEHNIEILNGKVFTLKKSGSDYKDSIVKLKTKINDLKTSKTCPTCGQELTKEHQTHIDEEISGINEEISEIETNMFGVADSIKNINNIEKIKLVEDINNKNTEIDIINENIEKDSLGMVEVLKEIGELNNDKNDVEKRKTYVDESNLIPTKIQNEELKIDILQQKIDNYDNSLKQIEENNNINKGIEAAKKKLEILEGNEADERENIFILKTNIGEKQLKIKNNELLLAEFKLQEYRDNVMNLYKKCVHRDGIPRQMLSNYILPKINVTLENILSVAPFKIWLDVDDLRPKLAYHDRPTAIIDCISASGKERTFSSVVLKFALNQINVKSKPSIFLLDEVMGKLSEDSIEEFIEILQLIKSNMKKVLIIEHRVNIEPDYILDVQLSDDGISSVAIE